MTEMPRKSILSVTNLELGNTYHKLQMPQNSLSPNMTPRESIYINSQSTKSLPRSSLQLKIKRLNDMKLTSLFEKDSTALSGFKNVPKPNICISEFWGAKEKYLKKTGYLNAYNELKKQHDYESLITTKSSRKLNSPYITDLETKTKTFFGGKKTETSKSNPLKVIFEVKEIKGSHGKESNLDEIIKKCRDLSKKNLNLKIQANKMKKIVDSYSEKRKNVGPRLKGLSNSTSQELINAYRYIE